MELTKKDLEYIRESLSQKSYYDNLKKSEEEIEQDGNITCGICEGLYFVKKTGDNAYVKRSKKFTEFAGFIGEACNNYSGAIETAIKVNDTFSQKSGFTIEKLTNDIVNLMKENKIDINFYLYEDSLLIEYSKMTIQDVEYIKEDMEEIIKDSEWSIQEANLGSMVIKRDIFENKMSWSENISIAL